MEVIVACASSRLASRQYRGLKKRLSERLGVMDLLGQVRQSIAKAMQMASESQVFTDFPECSILSTVERVSIKLKDPNVHDLLANWGPHTKFEVITFLIRDEDKRKQTIMTAELISGNGIVVKNAGGKQVMIVRLPNNDPTSFGKLMHPAPASLYKLTPVVTPIGTNYKIHRTGGQKESVMVAEKVPVSIYQVGKMAGVLGSSCAYWLKKTNDGGVLGHVHPKLVMKGNTLVVKFFSSNKDPQVRATILGTALLLLISEVYPQLRSMLSESMHALGGAV